MPLPFFNQDYFINGRNALPLDSRQDLMLTNSSEDNGITMLRFYRKRNTTDENDVPIEVNSVVNQMV